MTSTSWTQLLQTVQLDGVTRHRLPLLIRAIRDITVGLNKVA